MTQIHGRPEQLHGFSQAGGGLGLHEGLEIPSHRFDRLGPHRQGHPTIGTHRIDCHWERRDASTHGGIFKQQGFASTRFFHFTIRPFRDLKLGRHRLGDADQFPHRFQFLNEIPV